MDNPRKRYEDPHMHPVEVHPTVAWALVLCTLMTVLAMPVLRHWQSGHHELVENLTSTIQTAKASTTLWDLNHGLQRSIERIETHLEESSPILQNALPTVQWALLHFGGVGNETVYAGRRQNMSENMRDNSGGSLILRKDFDHLVGPPFLHPQVLERRRRSQPSDQPPLEPDPRPALLHFHHQLQAKGIELIFMPVPTHAAIHPEALGAQADRPLSNPSLASLLNTLRQAGVHVFDPSEILKTTFSGQNPKSKAYLHTDSHWSPAAVDTVAEALANEIQQLVQLPPADRDWTRTSLKRQGRGDLWQALKLPANRPLYAEETLQAQEVTTWDGRLWSPKRDAPILLLGDSFSTVYSDPALHWGSAAGLAEQLAYHLQRDINRLARPDGSSDQVRRDLARQSEHLGNTKVVVYQVATRELSFGDWPVVEMK